MPKVFLALVGLLYVGLAAWCVAQPETTSQKVGFTRNPGQGESEYLVIYGGLQLSLGLLFLLPLMRETALSTMLLACVIVHACLVTFRMYSFTQYSAFPKMTYQLATGEVVILVLSAVMLWLHSRVPTGT